MGACQSNQTTWNECELSSLPARGISKTMCHHRLGVALDYTTSLGVPENQAKAIVDQCAPCLVETMGDNQTTDVTLQADVQCVGIPISAYQSNLIPDRAGTEGKSSCTEIFGRLIRTDYDLKLAQEEDGI